MEGHGFAFAILKSPIFCNDHENISHNTMQGNPFPTMSATKNVNPHKVQKSTTNVMWHPKD